MSKSILNRLVEDRQRAWRELKSVYDAAAEAKRDLTSAEKEVEARVNADLDQYDERISSLSALEARNAEADEARALLGGGSGDDGGRSDTWLPGLGEYRKLQAEQRAVGTTGAFIPVNYASTFFDQLRNRTAVLAAGPVMLPVDGAGSVKVPKVTASVTVGGYAEASAITASDPTLDSITLDPKKFAAMTLVNREAVEDSNPKLREVVANSLMKDLAVELDRQFVIGDGSGQNLTGLRNITGFTPGASTGAAGGALTFAFLADTLAAAESANLDPDRLAWIMHSRTWGSVRKLSDSQLRPIVSIDPTVGVRSALWGKPVFISNSLSITETVGASTDCSTLLLVDMSQVVVAEARQPELKVSEDYKFAEDQLALRITARYDIGVPHPAAIVKTVGVRP